MRVLMLMATYNGRAFVDEQLDSLLTQEGVDVHVLVADDGSSDGTAEHLAKRADADPRIRLLTEGQGGSAAANFLRLMQHADIAGFDAVGFTDQDDIRMPGSVAEQLGQLRNFDVVSSDVMAFYPDGRRAWIVKSQPLRDYDFVTESAGPGSTFLFRPEAFARIRDAVAGHPLLSEVPVHDWLCYAVARSLGLTWFIAPHPTVRYRQHDDNVIGANRGAAQYRWRFRSLTDGTYRSQCAVVTRIAADASGDARLARIAEALANPTARNNRLLRTLVPELRRRARDRAVLGTLIWTGQF